jgi:acyl-CoA thioester hydrolase
MSPRDVPGFDFAATKTPHAASIDFNGHVNVGYYGVFFDEAADLWLPRYGLTDAYVKSEQSSLFASETRTRYFREVLPGGAMDVYARVEDVSPKALHVVMIMLDPTSGELIAALEILWLSVDLKTRRVHPMDAAIFAAFDAAKARHHAAAPELPYKRGRGIEFRR